MSATATAISPAPCPEWCVRDHDQDDPTEPIDALTHAANFGSADVYVDPNGATVVPIDGLVCDQSPADALRIASDLRAAARFAERVNTGVRTDFERTIVLSGVDGELSVVVETYFDEYSAIRLNGQPLSTNEVRALVKALLAAVKVRDLWSGRPGPQSSP